MITEIVVAVIAFCGTVFGSLCGIVVSSKLTNYRLQQLEEKVSDHNRFALRLPVVEEQITELFHRIKKLEEVEK